MALYRYKARNNAGVLITGEISASGLDEIRHELNAQALYLVSAAPATGFWDMFERHNPKELVFFSQQFEALFSAGLPAIAIISSIEKTSKSKGFKKALVVIRDSISKGKSISEAFAEHPKYFNEIFVAMVRAAEGGMGLAQAMNKAAKVLDHEYEKSTRLRVSTWYSKLVLLCCLAIIIYVSIYIFPDFKSFIKDAQRPIQFHWITGFYMALGDFLINQYLMAFLIVALAAIAYIYFKTTALGRYWLGWLRLNIPIIGPINSFSANAIFAHVLGALYAVGVPLTDALLYTANAVSNPYMAKQVHDLRGELLLGESFSNVIDTKTTFLPALKGALVIGEESGNLSGLLLSTAKVYDFQSDQMTELFTKKMQGYSSVLIALIVFSIAMGIYLAFGILYQST
ncbi:MAG: type II secretion system F family protein [Myxococcota bacterium]